MQTTLNNELLKTHIVKMLYFDHKLNVNEIAKQLNVSYWQLYKFMGVNNITRRNRSEAGFISNKTKAQFVINKRLSIADEKLKIAGIMLYWAEGTLKGNSVDFANSNPDIIKIYLMFLRQICGINEDRLRLYLYAYSYHNLQSVKDYWSKLTGIPIRNFTKPYIRKGNLNLSKRKLDYGLIHVRYNDKKLLKLIEEWIKIYSKENFIWAGTQVAKGGRLYNCSA